jgi:capsular polysaccharide export protein
MKIKPAIKKSVKSILSFLVYILTVVGWYISEREKSEKTTAFVFSVSKWKQPYIVGFLEEYRVLFVPIDQWLFLLNPIIKCKKNSVFIIWGYNENKKTCQFAGKKNIPLYRIEDGFVRSVGLGSMLNPPYSICLDKRGMYFDSTKTSDLEYILNTYDFANDKVLLDRSRKCIGLIKSLRISKYNHVSAKNVEAIYGKKTKKRILVIGQVEDDASIKKGSNKKWTNNDLVVLASKENKDAEIIYKPHPDVLTGRRPKQSNPKDVAHLAKIVDEPLSLVDSFQTIDHVYTITSLSGFEALLWGLPVTTVGAPFYSGWGLTDERQPVDRRNRKLSLEEVFAAAYLLYPRYQDPYTSEKLTLEETITRLLNGQENIK